MPRVATKSSAASPKSKDDAKRIGIEETVARLRSMIISGEIPPGAPVSQVKMSREFGVSTTPLREAMRRLQAEGFLESELNQRSRVPELDIDDLHSVFASRIMLDSLAASLTAASISDDEIDALRSDLDEMRREAERGDLSAWEESHARFHHRLVAGATLAMAPVLSNFFDRTERYRRLSTLRDQPRGWTVGDQEHERILEACVQRDSGAVAVELATHLARTALALSAAFAPEVDPAPVREAVRLIVRPETRRTRSNQR